MDIITIMIIIQMVYIVSDSNGNLIKADKSTKKESNSCTVALGIRKVLQGLIWLLVRHIRTLRGLM